MRGPELGLIFQEPMTRLDPLQTIEAHFRETIAHPPSPISASRRSAAARWRRSRGMGIPPTRFSSTRTSSRAGCASGS